MLSEYLQRVISDFALCEQARLHSTSVTTSKASCQNATTQYVYQVPSLLLTPPTSDAEPDITARSVTDTKRATLSDFAELGITPELSHMAKEEQIAMLLDRKKMLEAYLQSLAVDGQRSVVQSVLPEGKADAAEFVPSPVIRTFKPRIHKPYKLARVRRVRFSIKHLRSRRASAPSQVVHVNHVQIREDSETDEEDEEELLFQSFRRSISRSVLRATSETPESSPKKSSLKDLQAQLLQSQFAHLMQKDTPSTEDGPLKSLKTTPRINHTSISRHLREARLRTAIDGENNPIRYPRGRVIKPSILTPYSGLDVSDEEASVEIAPIIVAPRRAEILDRIESVARSLQESFPLETELLEPYIQNPEQGLTMVDIDLPGAPHGDVFWDNGVGKLQLDDTVRETIPSGNVHIFMDHSNVFLSWKATIQETPPLDLSPKARTIMSLPILSLILQRGRAVHPKGMHLAGSSPLMQSFDPAIKLGWECSILKRVPAGGVMHDLKRGAIDDIKQTRQISNSNNRKQPTVNSRDFAEQVSVTSLLVPSSIAPVITTTTSGYDTISSSETEAEVAARVGSFSPAQSPMTRSSVARYSKGSPSDMYRMKEQAVDELLHLKILQTILSGRGKRPGTIVLATGDARGGQYNEHGFLGCVREAIARGWNVELWAFQNGMSRSWIDCAKKEGWIKTGRFAVWNLDHWLKELTQVV